MKLYIAESEGRSTLKLQLFSYPKNVERSISHTKMFADFLSSEGVFTNVFLFLTREVINIHYLTTE